MLTKNDAIRLAKQIQGWCDGEELSWIFDRAAEIPVGGLWIEVGCWKGRSLAAAALGVPDKAKVFACDHFQGNPESLTHFEARFPGWVEGHVKLLMDLTYRECGRKVIYLQKMTSLAAAFHMAPSFADAIYLDPDWRDSAIGRAYEGCKADIVAWLPKLKPGGLLCGRNHWHHFPGVQRAVDELLPDRELPLSNLKCDPACSIWAWRKPK
jgi:hypothetical protein